MDDRSVACANAILYESRASHVIAAPNKHRDCLTAQQRASAAVMLQLKGWRKCAILKVEGRKVCR
jgi:hypothetical protein